LIYGGLLASNEAALAAAEAALQAYLAWKGEEE
jgi:hypothetical protein